MTLKIPTGLNHATVVALDGDGLLIVGPAGSGKSGLALQMLALGAELVADDQVMLSDTGNGIQATPPAELAGSIEARFLGILQCSFRPAVEVSTVVDLSAKEVDRLPQLHQVNIGTRRIDLIRGGNVPNLASALVARSKGQRLH